MSQNSYAFVSQGLADRIIELKPLDRRILIEEAANIDNEPTSIKVYGSLDNSTWIELDAATTKTVQTAPCANAYDLDAKGKMPFMCIEVDPDGNTDGAKGAIVYIVDHLE